MLFINTTAEVAAAQSETPGRREFARLLSMVAAAMFGLLAVCGGAQAQPLEVYMPPNAFIHPFAGRVAVMTLPHKPGSPMLSLSSHSTAGVCAVWLPKVGDPDITQALYECLAVIEVANCNGADRVLRAGAVRPALLRRELGLGVQRRAQCGSRQWRPKPHLAAVLT